jgi:hypothetical protein
MKSIKKYLIVSVILLAVGFVGLGVTGVVANYKYGSGIGYSCESNSSKGGAGHMFGTGGMMGMMGSSWFSNKDTSLESYSFKEVKEKTENYLEENNLEDLQIAEIMEFSNNFYMEIVEKDTNKGAMELLLDRNTGNIFPEYGPNMMWNTKYGLNMHMIANQADADMSIDEEGAIQLAEKYLNKRDAGEFIGEEADIYYGYYTIHTVTEEGKIAGMLSVNGFTGQVWYHNWHRVFVDMEEYEIY